MLGKRKKRGTFKSVVKKKKSNPVPGANDQRGTSVAMARRGKRREERIHSYLDRDRVRSLMVSTKAMKPKRGRKSMRRGKRSGEVLTMQVLTKVGCSPHCIGRRRARK